MKQVKSTQPYKLGGLKTEIAAVGSLAVGWLVVMLQLTSITNPVAWVAPCCIIVVYLLFRMWSAAIDTKIQKPVQPATKPLSWKQYAIQYVTFCALYFTTTGLLRSNLDTYNLWLSVIIALTYLYAVPFVLNRFVWTKFFPPNP